MADREHAPTETEEGLDLLCDEAACGVVVASAG